MKASRDGYVEVAVLLAAIFAGLIPLASLSAHDQESPATGEKSLLSLSDLEELARRSNPRAGGRVGIRKRAWPAFHHRFVAKREHGPRTDSRRNRGDTTGTLPLVNVRPRVVRK